MRKVEVKAIVNNCTASKVFPIICDFKEYEHHSNVVRSVDILEENGQYSISNWEVNFRQGILRWTEKDHFFPETFTILFQQTKGDAEHFSGKWILSDTEKGCAIHFEAEFDMGIPSLRDIIEPIAEQALQENIQAILKGLLKDKVSFIANGQLF